MTGSICLSYSASLLFYTSAFVFNIMKMKKAEHQVGLLALTSNTACAASLAISSGHFPVFELFESLLSATCFLGFLGMFCTNQKNRFPDTRTWVWLKILLLLFITLFFSKNASPANYSHHYIYIILFHGLRIITLSVVFFSSALFIQARIVRKQEGSANEISHKGRNFLLLGTVFFLTSEYVGIIWCQNGWGDFWHWSAGFFQSTLIVLYLMIALHVPGKSSKSERIRELLGSISGFFILSLILIRSLL